ncbi:protein SRC2-like [Andrographis paniculata]|uniref:protein SRC2-like n=1 Tax=Andrographis paniculata TaxID=175694 RepID=UPI0021E6DED0|nr:protein SRC2-like [Andrographis paniculata]
MEYRTLEVILQSGMDLNKVNLFTKMDVYVVVSISGGDVNQIQKTKSPVDHDGDANPNWNFPMKFTIDEALLQMNRLALNFKLICQRALGDKDVGDVTIPIKELLDSQSKGGAADGKKTASYQVRKPSGKPKGQLTFSYNLSEKSTSAATATAAAPPPYGSAIPFAPQSGKAEPEPVTAYPAGPSSGYPPTGVYPPPAGYAGPESGSHYPPPPAYPKPDGGGYYPPPPPGGYSYPPPPPPGYGYPQPPAQPGYGYPPPPGYGYGPPVQPAQPKKNKFGGLGLGAGLLGGAIGGLLVGDMISDAADFDGGFDF